MYNEQSRRLIRKHEERLGFRRDADGKLYRFRPPYPLGICLAPDFDLSELESSYARPFDPNELERGGDPT